MAKFRSILAGVLSFSMLGTVITPEVSEFIGLESRKIYAETVFGDDYSGFKDYVRFITEHFGSGCKEGDDLDVWSAQQWFNYKYGKIDSEIEQLSTELDDDRNRYYGTYSVDGTEFESYTNMEIDASNRYDTMFSLRCAIQIELLYYSQGKDLNSGNYLTINDMYGFNAQGDKINYFGSFGEGTRKAFDQLVKDYGGLDKLPENIIRIINYGLVIKGYGGLESDGVLKYSSGKSDGFVLDGIKDLIRDAGIKDKYSDINNDFDSILLKAILNTDSYTTYNDADDKIRELQQFLNSRTYSDFISEDGIDKSLGIGPCDGVYGRDTCKRLIYFYQKLIFEGTDIQPNGYFGNGTLSNSPDISDYSALNSDLKKVLQYAYYVNGFDCVSSDNVYRLEKSAQEFKKFMNLPGSGDTVTYKGTIKSLLSSAGDGERTALACDTNIQLKKEDIQKLKEAGYKYIGRYVVDERFEKKRLTNEEAENIVDAGLKIIPIYQGFNCGDPDDFTKIKAQKDAVDSMNSAVKIGIPKGSVLYFAVDCDPQGEEIENYVIKYFDELNRLMLFFGNLYKIGVYGTRNVCQKVYDAGYASSAYVADASTGFSGNMGYRMPSCWAFDQFNVSYDGNEIYAGNVQIDKVAVSGIDQGVSRLDKGVEEEYKVRKQYAVKAGSMIWGNMYGDPVNLSDGSHEIEYSAVSVTGAQNIEFALNYSSSEESEGEMGRGWTHNYDKHLEFITETQKTVPVFETDSDGCTVISDNEYTEKTYVKVFDSPGKCIRYSETEKDVFHPDNELLKGYELRKNTDGSWNLDRNHSELYCFDVNGNLTGIRSKEGLFTKIENSSDKIVITDEISGKSITGEKKDGRIISVYSDKTVANVEFSYTDGLLTAINDLNNHVITYTYDDFGRVLTGTDGEGITYFTDSYYDDNYFSSYYDELGLNSELSGEDFNKADTNFGNARKAKYGKIRTQTDALGNVSHFDYIENYSKVSDDDCVYTLTVKVTDRNGNNTESVYDDKNMLVSYTDQNGDTVKYEYNNNGDLISVTDPAGKSELMTYDERHNTISKTDKNGLITEYEYDVNNNVTKIVNKDKQGKEYSFSEYKYDGNLLTEMTDVRGVVTSYKYSDKGLLISKTANSDKEDERSQIYTYKDGLLNTFTDSNGGKILTNHNAQGLIESYTDSEGHIVKKNKFDKSGNIVSENIYFSDTESNEIIYAFDSRGNEILKSDSIGKVFEKTYNGNGKITTMKDVSGNISSYEYDNEDRIISYTDAEGNTEKYEYDAGGRITNTIRADGFETRCEYNSSENSVKTTIGKKDEEGNYEIYSSEIQNYDGYGNLIQKTDSYGTVTSYKYNDKGYLSEIVFAEGKDEEYSVCYEYNDYGDCISVINGEGNEQKYEYDSFGNKISYTDANGNCTTYSYDKCGNLITETDPVQAKLKKFVSYKYDKNGRMVSAISPSGYTTSYEYDYQGRNIAVTDAEGYRSSTGYDVRGNVIEVINDNKIIVSSNNYDERNNLISETDALNNITSYSYDKKGRVTSVTDPMGFKRTFSYDEAGNMVSSTNSDNITAKAEYDALGNIIKTSDGNFTDTVYIYDKAGNIVSKPTTSGSEVKYGYNALNLCTEIINGRNQKTKYKYDKAGRVIEEIKLDQDGNAVNTIKYSYDKNGNVLSASDNSGVITRTFDELNRVTSYTDTFGETITYSYDLEGNISKINYPDDGTKKIFVNYEYDKNDKLVKVIDWENRKTEYSYDNIGQLVKIKRPDGSQGDYTYDKAGNLISLGDKTKDEGVISSYSYKYDKNGNPVKETSEYDNSISEIEYDSVGRLVCRTTANKKEWIESKSKQLKEAVTSETSKEDFQRKIWSFDAGTTTKERFIYDPSGNIKIFNRTVNYDGVLKKTLFSENNYYDIGNRLIRYTFNNGTSITNSILSMSLGVIPAYFGIIPVYDNDGNMISGYIDGNKTDLNYDPNNNLTSCGELEYTYDVESNRIKVSENGKVTTYLYDTTRELPRVIKKTTDGHSTIYVYGVDLISETSGDEHKYYHFDYHGSTVALTASDGTVTDRYNYDVYGSASHTEGTSDTQFGYNGSEGVITDSNGFLYLTTRYYSPELKRFITADKLTGSIENIQSMNRYAYCEGNPVNYSDPFGLSPEMKAKKQAQIEVEKRAKISSKVHGTLDAAGMLPGVGMIPDGINFVIFAFEGDLVGASLSATAFLPIVGEFSTPAKYGSKLAVATAGAGADNAFRMTGKYADDVAGVITKESKNSFSLLEKNTSDFDNISSFADLMDPQDAKRYNKFFTKDAIVQLSGTDKTGYICVPPGTTYLTGIHVKNNVIQPWEAYYDEFGNILVRNDYNAGNIAQNIPNNHHHVFQRLNGSNQEDPRHFPGSYRYSITNNPANGWKEYN